MYIICLGLWVILDWDTDPTWPNGPTVTPWISTTNWETVPPCSLTFGTEANYLGGAIASGGWFCFLDMGYVPGTWKPTSSYWLFQLDDSKSLHQKWLLHQTTILKWMFRVPGRGRGRIHTRHDNTCTVGPIMKLCLWTASGLKNYLQHAAILTNLESCGTWNPYRWPPEITRDSLHKIFISNMGCEDVCSTDVMITLSSKAHPYEKLPISSKATREL